MALEASSAVCYDHFMQTIDLLKSQEHFLKTLTHQGKSFNTLKNYRIDLKCFFEFYTLKNKSYLMTSFSQTEANEYNHYLQKKFNSPNSIRRGIQAVRLFFDFLVVQYSFANNPLKSVVVSPKVVKKPSPPPMPSIFQLSNFLQEEIKLSSELSQLIHKRNLVIVHLIYHGGAKVSDLEEMKVNDILLDPKSKLARLMFKPRQKEPFSVPLPQPSVELIQDYIKDLPSKDFLLFNANAFKLISGGLSARGTELLFSEWRRKLKNKMNARSLRQACIFRWINQGKPESLIKEWMNVAPNYSLEPYQQMLQSQPLSYLYQDLQYES